MSYGTPTVRAHLHDAIQHTVAINEDLPEGAMLLGWVTVAEWMAPDGQRWLSIVDGTSDPERSAPPWQVQGYLHNALNDPSGFVDYDDDESGGEDD